MDSLARVLRDKFQGFDSITLDQEVQGFPVIKGTGKRCSEILSRAAANEEGGNADFLTELAVFFDRQFVRRSYPERRLRGPKSKKKVMVFDWPKATRLILQHRPRDVLAFVPGLPAVPLIVEDTVLLAATDEVVLSSKDAPPTLVMDGDVDECWVYRTRTNQHWANRLWPDFTNTGMKVWEAYYEEVNSLTTEVEEGEQG